MVARFTAVLCLLLIVSCSPDSLPADYVVDDDCVRVNEALIEPTEDDPHEGFKHVYLCNVDPGLLVSDDQLIFPYPDGTKYIKVSTLEGSSFPWLIATAEKVKGDWEWKEYTRNFKNEDYLLLPVDESVCTNCHKKAKATDYIFTAYSGNVFP